MEEKETLKISLSTFFLFIAIIVIIAMGIYIYIEKTNANKEIEGLKANTTNLQTTIENLQDKVNNSSNTITSNNVVSDKKNFETVNDMSIELAYGILNKYKVENLPDARWYITDVKLIAHGDNNTYLVSYSDYNLDGYEEGASTIIQYKDGKWATNLPGFTGTSDEEMSKYNFVNY